MKKHLSIVAAAALAVAAMGLNAQAQDAPPADQPNAAERAVDRTGDALNRAADKTGDALKSAADKTGAALKELGPGKEEIHDVLAQVAEAAMTKDGLDDLTERLVDADRNRIGQQKEAIDNVPELDGLIQQLQDDWKGKYGHEFDIKDEDKLYNGFAMIYQGEIPEGARTAGERVSGDATTAGPGASASGNVGGVSGSATVNPDAGTAKVDVDTPKTGVDAPKTGTDGQTAADRNLNDPGRNIAHVVLPASHGMPELKVPLIHEAGGWRIDIPDSVDGAKLRDNVKNALTKCKEHKDKWPTDETEAYRAVSHKVLAAIMDKPLDDAQKASGTEAPTAQPAANPQ